MLNPILFSLSLAFAVLAGSAGVAGEAPGGLEAMRKDFSAAVAKHDVAAVAALTAFPLAFSGYEHPDKVTDAEFADEFDGLFFSGDAQLANCLATTKLEPAQSDFPASPWMIDCDGNIYYFGERKGAWMFTAYENINERPLLPVSECIPSKMVRRRDLSPHFLAENGF